MVGWLLVARMGRMYRVSVGMILRLRSGQAAEAKNVLAPRESFSSFARMDSRGGCPHMTTNSRFLAIKLLGMTNLKAPRNDKPAEDVAVLAYGACGNSRVTNLAGFAPVLVMVWE